MAGDECRFASRHWPIGHVQPFDQFGTLGHRHHQFLALEQCAHPLGQAVFADGVEGFGEFVAALVDAIATGLGVGLTSRSNWAKDSGTFSISLPIEVVVLNCCVTDTKDTSWRSVLPLEKPGSS